MTTAYTSLLGLALPVTGELSGTWGDVVNNSITNLVDSAVAGTTTLSTDADVILTTSQGASNQARQAVIRWTAAGTITRYITAPAQSKTYIVINQSSTQSIVIRGVGPTVGVTVDPNKTAIVAWNGSDYQNVALSIVDLATQVTGVLAVTNGGTGTTTSTGTGSVVLSANASLTTPNLGVPSAVTLTNATGLPLTTGVTGTLPVTSGGTGVTTSTGSGNVVLSTAPALSAATYGTTNNVTAGTNAQGQGALTSDLNIITTAAANPSGVTLPTATQGRKVIVVNRGANPINIYPATGAAIDSGAANASVQLPVNGWIEFNASSTTQWYSTGNLNIIGGTLTSEVYSTTAAVTAGTNAQGQGALTSDYNVITTAASAPSGVTLPTATVGRRIIVVNRGANAVNIFPATGGQIDAAGANAAVQVPVNGWMEFNASSTTQWYSTIGIFAAENYSTNAAVTAGTNAQGQGAITADYNVVTTAANAPSGVTLPTATTGRRVIVVNRGANAVNIYPATGGQIDAYGANAAVQIPVNGRMQFDASSATQWYSSGTQTVTQNVRVVAVADATSITPDANVSDIVTQANTQVAGTLTINAPTGTPFNGQKLIIRILCTNAQTLSFNVIYAGSSDLALPTSTSGSSKYDYLGFVYNSTAAKWQMLAKVFGF